jgi:hypothetical protein
VAFYHALLDEDIWVDPPAGEETEADMVWQLLKALYGTRRAALLFQEYVISTLKSIGSVRIMVAAQVFYHKEWQILAVVHGDDFAAAGEPHQLSKLDEALGQFFVLKLLPRVGPPELGGVAEGRFTKRWITFRDGAFSWSADETHILKVIDYCCGDKKITERDIGPGSKSIGKAVKNAAEELDGDDWSNYRTIAPTAHYVAADRPDTVDEDLGEAHGVGAASALQACTSTPCWNGGSSSRRCPRRSMSRWTVTGHIAPGPGDPPAAGLRFGADTSWRHTLPSSTVSP